MLEPSTIMHSLMLFWSTADSIYEGSGQTRLYAAKNSYHLGMAAVLEVYGAGRNKPNGQPAHTAKPSTYYLMKYNNYVTGLCCTVVYYLSLCWGLFFLSIL